MDPRVHPPRPVRSQRAIVVLLGATPACEEVGFTVNVSREGLRLAASVSHERGEVVFLDLQTEGAPCRLEARVVWARASQVEGGLPWELGLTVLRSDDAWGALVAEAERQAGVPVPHVSPARDRPDPRPPVPRARRHKVRLRVRFGVGEALELKGRTRDVSSTGLGLATASPLPFGTDLRLEIEVGPGRRAHCRGRCTREDLEQGPEGHLPFMAVHFTEVDHTWTQFVLHLSRGR